MAQRGHTCRKIDRRGRLEAEPFDVELAGDDVLVRFHGRLVRTLTGADADAVRAVCDDPEKLQKVLGRKTGNARRGGHGGNA